MSSRVGMLNCQRDNNERASRWGEEGMAPVTTLHLVQKVAECENSYKY